MKLLILTQKIDRTDDVLGAYHEWVERLSREFEAVTVICLSKGDVSLPANVSVVSLGKDEGCSRLTYLRRFFSYIRKYNSEYDAVFVHMNSEYVILGYFFWHWWGKPVALWYNHTYGNWRARLAFRLADRIFYTSPYALPAHTVSRSRAERMPAGIDTERFKALPAIMREPYSILYVGRIAPLKRIDVLIDAFGRVKETLPGATLSIVGSPGQNDYAYLAGLKKQAERCGGAVRFRGSIPNRDMPRIYAAAAVTVNLTPKGNYDKTVLESMACETPVVLSSEAFAGAVPPEYMFREGSADDLAWHLVDALRASDTDSASLRSALRRYVVETHDLDMLAGRLKKSMESLGTVTGRSGKKILIATPLYPPDIGGPATYAKLLEEKLPAYGFDVKVVSFGLVRHLPKIIRHLAYFFNILRAACGADIVFAQDPVSVGLPSFLAARACGKRYIVKIVGDYAWEQGVQRFGIHDSLDQFVARNAREYPLPIRILKRVEAFVARHADTVIVPSRYLQSVVGTWGAVSRADIRNIKVIHNSVDPIEILESKDELRERYGFSGPVIMSAGRLVPWKGFDTVIEIIPPLTEQFPNITVRIAGSGPDGERLKQLARERGVAESVAFLGQLDRTIMHRYIKAADVFVLNTGYEGFSHLLIEVMGTGTPIITTRVGGNPDLIAEGSDGILVDYDDRDALIRSVIDLLSDKSHREALAIRAQEKARSFSGERMLGELIKEFV